MVAWTLCSSLKSVARAGASMSALKACGASPAFQPIPLGAGGTACHVFVGAVACREFTKFTDRLAFGYVVPS